MMPADGRAWAPAAPRAAFRVVPDAGTLLVCALTLGVSGGLLWQFGINYDGLTGSAAQKIHPATYLAVLLTAWAFLRTGNPVANLIEAVERRPASALLAAAGIGLAAQIAYRGGAGLAGAIDTFVLPALIMILMIDSDAGTRRRLETIVYVIMTANALIGVAELAIGQRFFPYRLDGAVFPFDTRSGGLQGHPLVNATVTATYVVALITGAGRLPSTWRLTMIALQLAALVAFGGRSAIVWTVLIGGVCGLGHVASAARRGAIPVLAVAAVFFLVPLAAAGVAGLAFGGFFDQLLARFDNDGGSANARWAMLDIAAALPLLDLVIGPDAAYVESLRRIGGLEMGIENPIMRVMLYQGALMAGLLTLAVALYIVELKRMSRPGIAMTVLTFVVLINTFESIGAKMTILAKFAVLLLALYRPLDPDEEQPI